MSDKHEMRFSRIFTGVNLEGYYANGRINWYCRIPLLSDID
jgi:hypothetical protein